MFITSIASASFSRVDTEKHLRNPFFVYLDEFQNFTTLSLVNMLSELRKFKVGMTLAHQYLHQLDDKVYHSIIGNIGSMLCFRLGSEDALRIAKEYYPDFEMIDLINMPNYKMYIKLLIEGKGSMPFSGITML